MTSTSARSSSTTWIGLVLSVFGYWMVSLILNLPPLVQALSQSTRTLLGLLLAWVLAGFLLFIVKRAEGRPFSSIGLRSITVKEVGLAIGIGLALSLSVPLLTWLVSRLLPAPPEGSIEQVATSTSWLLLLFSILTAAVTEEVIYRGYTMECLIELSGSRWLAVGVSVIAFVLPHTLSWNTAHVVGVVLPLGIILSLLYLWRRNLLFNMIVHFMVNLPLVFIALSSGSG